MQNIFITGITGKSGMYFLEEIENHDDSNYSFSLFFVRSEKKAEYVKAKYPEA